MGYPFWYTPAPLPAEDCGFAYDHDDRLVCESDGSRTYRCARCGDTYTTKNKRQQRKNSLLAQFCRAILGKEQ